MKEQKIPKKFLPYLGTYGVMFHDSSCGEPIAWGYPVVAHLGNELWAEISKYGSLECNHSFPSSQWYLITKTLTPEEAVEKYGQITDLELGPRGGFRSVTYGDKNFISKRLKPEDNLLPKKEEPFMVTPEQFVNAFKK